jgi:hypothetical protein
MNIEFIEGCKNLSNIVPPPRPAKCFIPQMYKEAKPINLNKVSASEILQNPPKSVKMCYPFLDAYTAGYIQETWCDIHFEIKNGEIYYAYPSEIDIVSSRESAFSQNNYGGTGFHPVEFLWRRYWIPKVPRGYSVLITHPLSRFDLPFYTLSGVVDSDNFYHSPTGQIPFYLKDDFSGVIPCGTPMYQIIPIKRDTWKSKTVEFSEEVKNRSQLLKQSFFSNYKNKFRQNKKYF